MNRTIRSLALTSAAALLPTLLAAGQGPEIPSWMSVDHDAKTVSISLVAGQTTANNNWNMNGLVGGEATIVVPVGYNVSIDFSNNDPTMMVHSVGIGQRSQVTEALFTDPAPVFPGAITPAAADPANATASGSSATIDFAATTAGDYALICYVPGHTLTGMWLGFRVSDDGSVGLE